MIRNEVRKIAKVSRNEYRNVRILIYPSDPENKRILRRGLKDIDREAKIDI